MSLRPPAAEILNEHLPPPGSDAYYALLYAPAPLRHSLALLEGYRSAIAGIPFNCSSPDVARAKLAWWQDEIARLGTGEERHVLCRALAPLAPDGSELKRALAALVTGVDELLIGQRFASAAARQRAYDAAHGPLWAACARLCGVTDPATERASRDLGSAIELAYALRDARRCRDGGVALLCAETEQASGLGEEALGRLSEADRYARVIALDIAGVRVALSTARDALAPRERRRLRPLVVLSRIADATLAEVLADGCRVWERRVELTPLRKLWIAWRVRLRA